MIPNNARTYLHKHMSHVNESLGQRRGPFLATLISWLLANLHCGPRSPSIWIQAHDSIFSLGHSLSSWTQVHVSVDRINCVHFITSLILIPFPTPKGKTGRAFVCFSSRVFLHPFQSFRRTFQFRMTPWASPIEQRPTQRRMDDPMRWESYYGLVVRSR